MLLKKECFVHILGYNFRIEGGAKGTQVTQKWHRVPVVNF